MAEADPLPYEAACERMEAIVRRLDSGEAGLRETLELCQEGRRLVEDCAVEREAVARGLEEARPAELASTPAAPGAAPPAGRGGRAAGGPGPPSRAAARRSRAPRPPAAARRCAS